ncbi:MAG: DUF5676 family membrane protein [Leptospirales bacterium]|jgi:hypothetical protein
MGRINIRKFGLAWGATASLFYIGCIILMLTVGREGAVLFFNSLLHGLDVSGALMMDVPWWQALFGIGQTFVLAYLAGGCVAGIYNFSLKD